jgi:transcriptional regulator with XRE-family HTH domain
VTFCASALESFLRRIALTMSAREAFGPNLRRLRLQRGLTLEQIADRTKVSAALWDGLEQNDLSKWPSGIFARAYVREYAEIIGADADATIDEFCRWFPQGDRRAERLIRGQAEIVGHPLDWQDQVSSEADRRAGGARLRDEAKKPRPFATFLRRVLSRA